MPFFDFKCTACGYVFEERISINSRFVPLCPRCGGETQKQVAIPGRAKVIGGTGASKQAW